MPNWVRAAVLSVFCLPALGATAQAEDAAQGVWRVDGFGFTFDYVVEPARTTGGPHEVTGVVRMGASGAACPPALIRLCEKAEKDGPFVLWGQITPVQQNNDAEIFSMRVNYAGGGDPIVFDMAQFERGDAHLSYTVPDTGSVGATALYQNNDLSRPARWAEGNWTAELDGVRVEAALASTGDTALDGTLAVHPGGYGMVSSAILDNWRQVIADYYPFAMRVDAQRAAFGLHFPGRAETGPEYTQIGQSADISFIPFEGIGLVTRLYNPNFGADWSEPFLMVPMDGPLTPVPPPSGQRSQTGELEQNTAVTPLQGGELAGLWSIAGSSLTLDLVIDPQVEGGAYPTYLVATGGPGPIYPCPAEDMPLMSALCERIEKGFPVVFAGTLSTSARSSSAEPGYAGTLASDWADAIAVNFIVGASHMSGLFTNQAQFDPHLGRRVVPVQASKLEEKFTPASAWADGNWFYDDGSVRFELGLGANGPDALAGEIRVVPPSGEHAYNSANAVLADWAKVATEQGGFSTAINARLGQLGSFFDAGIAADFGPDARIRIMPVENNALVILLDDAQGGDALPFTMMRTDALSAVPAASGPAPLPQPAPGGGGAQQHCTAAGTWQARHGGPFLRFLNDDPAFLPVSLSITGALDTTITAPWRTETLPAIEEQDAFRDRALSAADSLGPMSGQTASAWLGPNGATAPAVVAHKTNGDPPLILLAGCERAVLLTNGQGYDVYADLLTIGQIGIGSRLFFLERTSALSQAAATGSSGQSGSPSQGPAAAATGLMGVVDPAAPCASLRNLEMGLWAGAADGSVALDDLRALSMIMYPAGVGGAGLSNDGQCAGVLAMLQGEMAQRNLQ